MDLAFLGLSVIVKVLGVFCVWKQGRDDDNLETIHKRFKLFNEHTLPVVKHYESIATVHKVKMHNWSVLVRDSLLEASSQQTESNLCPDFALFSSPFVATLNN